MCGQPFPEGRQQRDRIPFPQGTTVLGRELLGGGFDLVELPDASGQVTEQPRITLFQNGVLAQNNESFNGPTGIQYGDFRGQPPTGPLVLQGDHDPVQFRNIWIVPL